MTELNFKHAVILLGKLFVNHHQPLSKADFTTKTDKLIFEGMALVRNLATMAEIIDTIWDIEANLTELIKIFMMETQQHLDQGSLTEGGGSVHLDSLC